jgi:PKD domain
MKLVCKLFIMVVLCFGMFSVAHLQASEYTMTIDCNPQMVGINSSAVVTINLFKDGDTPVAGQNVFLGLEDISGKLESEMVVTDSEGVATTTFFPSEIGEGYIIAKVNIRQGSSIIPITSETVVIVSNLNQKPVAMITHAIPNPVKVGETIQFAGVGKDIDGEVVEWKWNMGDGTSFSGKGSDSSITHIFDKVGKYKVTFQVKDDSDAWSNPSWITIKVFKNQKPTVEMMDEWKRSGLVGQEIMFEILVKDVDENLVGCRFEWGDGKTNEFKLTGSRAQIKARHTYEKIGDYHVRVVAFDRSDESTAFPENGWKIKIQGLAKGGIRILVAGFGGEKVDFIGPFPSRNIVISKVMEDWGVEVEAILIPGKYQILSADRSQAFRSLKGNIEVESFKTVLVKCKRWKPSIDTKFQIKNNNSPELLVNIVDSSGIVSKPVMLNLLEQNELIQTSSGNNGTFCLPVKNLNSKELIIEFNVESVVGRKKIQIPKVFPGINLVVRPYGEESVQLQVSGDGVSQIQLDTKVVHLLTRKQVRADRIISIPPRSMKSGFVTININRSDSFKYLVCITATSVVRDIKVTNNISFVPYLGTQKIDMKWGYSDDSVLFSGCLKDKENDSCIRYQKFTVFVKPGSNTNRIPIQTLTPSSGCFLLSYEIDKLLKEYDTGSLEIEISTISAGITFSESFDVRRYDRHPKLSLAESGNNSIEIQLLYSTSEPVSGKWMCVFYLKGGVPIQDDATMKTLGYPDCSVRTSKDGVAFLPISTGHLKDISLLVSVSEDGYQILKEFKFGK